MPDAFLQPTWLPVSMCWSLTEAALTRRRWSVWRCVCVCVWRQRRGAYPLLKHWMLSVCVCVCLGTQLCRGQEWLLLDNMHYSQYAHAGRQFSLLMSRKYAHNKLRGFSKGPQKCGFRRMDKDGKHLCSQTNRDSNCMGCMWRIHLIFMLFFKRNSSPRNYNVVVSYQENHVRIITDVKPQCIFTLHMWKVHSAIIYTDQA